jgi:hypothetical protein
MADDEMVISGAWLPDGHAVWTIAPRVFVVWPVQATDANSRANGALRRHGSLDGPGCSTWTSRLLFTDDLAADRVP